MTQTKTVELGSPSAFKVSDTTYASVAESLMSRYMEHDRTERGAGRLTTTKLRSIYSLIMNIYVKVNTQQEYEQHKSDIQYLKVRMAYEAGRERAVKEFLQATHLMELIGSVSTFEQFRLYCRYAESLVAYFKFFGGKDS